MAFALFVALAQFGCSRAWAQLTTAREAELVVTGWLSADPQPLGTKLGRRVANVAAFADDNGEPLYYVVYLLPSGFVVVPADDLVEPIIAFADDATYDLSLENPLAALVIADLNARVAAVRAELSPQAEVRAFTVCRAQQKWHHFIALADSTKNKFAATDLGSISDARVEPLVESKWHQNDVCEKLCYNYYTPNNYYCGCVATAMAQLMRYHRHPNSGIGAHEFTIKVDGTSQAALTIGGDGHGGPYYWSDMPLDPNCYTTDAQRRAIGAICYDAGVSVNTEYESDGSGANTLKTKDALTNTFKYSNAIKGFRAGDDIGPGLIGMVNPNLDYKHPVILGLWREGGGHAVLCDGYGYNASTLYHHLNMGWAGNDDAWYNLPDVDADLYTYTSVVACTYNIFVSGTGEIISGRVTDASGYPVSTATVTAVGKGGPFNTTTNAKGIYALANVASASTYTVRVAKTGYMFTDRFVKTGTSSDETDISGNKWEIDFVGILIGDCDADGDVDIADLAMFGLAWLAKPGDAGWNPACDIGTPANDFIDTMDFAVFANNWQVGVK